MTVTGTVVREDLGPGTFLLVTADGQRFALKGGDEGLLRAGQTVEVEGKVVQNAMGIGMTGAPVLEVSSYKAG